ncbi:transcriptional regulator GcvA [Arenibaculum pallidiluteum]|uniref:transcriptional regulator GcvA n=1 Tax=Arenibaculum pallidiluteum TaxID=2812559 RepID=UPI001A960EFE|nr:transcriptional regulator GcvA [Arenibaculum pallidiluteum]
MDWAGLPSLNAVRAFEVVARHGSFSRAAEELHVTPAAVSHQIRALEATLGVALLRRTSRRVELTEAGRACYPAIRDGFEQLRAALNEVRAPAQRASLTVTSGPGFASKILAPRLHRFAERCPGIETRLSASWPYADLEAEGIDVAIRFGIPERVEAAGSALHVERLVEDSVLPLCSPELVRRAGLHAPGDLRRAPLIHDDSLKLVDPEAPDWRRWAREAGIGPGGLKLAGGVHFNHPDNALEAAADSAGVVLGRRVLAAADMARGRLVSPFGPELPSGLWFHLVSPRSQADRPEVSTFRDWIRAELAAG